MDFVRIILTSILSVVGLFIITKLMGHKQVAQLDFFDYVSGITIGSIGAELATELESPWRPLIALGVYGLVSMLFSLFALKIPRSRKIINGTPTVFFSDGTLYRDNLKKAKIDLNEFMLLCREQGYFDLEDIKTAVFEHNGRLSILPKSDRRPIAPRDMKISVGEESIPLQIISDGTVVEKNLSLIGYDRRRLEKELGMMGYKNVGEIFLAVFNIDKKTIKVFDTN